MALAVDLVRRFLPKADQSTLIMAAVWLVGQCSHLRERAPSEGDDIHAWGYEAGDHDWTMSNDLPRFEKNYQQCRPRRPIGSSAASVSQTPHC
jgi:hypothetical protein